MLARLVEVLVSLDRAQHLAEQGLFVQVATLFDRGISPRNIGIFASLQGERLPAA
jgi:replicative DNA helicase